jgi:hypothetical protein
MKKFLFLFVVVLALVPLVAISCNQTVETEMPLAEPQFAEPPSTESPSTVPASGLTTGEPQMPAQEPSNSLQTLSPGCAGLPVFTHFEANPSTITWGQSTLLEWGAVTDGATGPLVDSVVLTPGNFGNLGSPGSVRVSPKTTTTYTLAATGCGGAVTKSVTVVVQIFDTPLPIHPPTSPGSGWSAPHNVTSVIVKAVPPSYTGMGPTTVNFIADITVDGPCTITYNWVRSDGAISQVETLFFSAAGTKQATSSWILERQGHGTSVLWERLSIMTPTPILSNKAEFILNITP